MTATARTEPTCANGSAATVCAHQARYAASQPFSQAIASAADGTTGSTTAAARPRIRSGPATGQPSTFAGTA